MIETLRFEKWNSKLRFVLLPEQDNKNIIQFPEWELSPQSPLTNLKYKIPYGIKQNYQEFQKFCYFSLTLYLAHSRVGRGNLRI